MRVYQPKQPSSIDRTAPLARSAILNFQLLIAVRCASKITTHDSRHRNVSAELTAEYQPQRFR